MDTKVRQLRDFLEKGQAVNIVLKHKKGQTKDRQVNDLFTCLVTCLMICDVYSEGC